jgi:hypothetical protein
MRAGFDDTVSALCYSILREETAKLPPTDGATAFAPNAVVNFVLDQHRRMPDFLRFPLVILTIAFDFAGLRHEGVRFHRMSPAARQRQIERWRRSSSRVARDFVRLYDSLAIFGWTSMIVASQQAVAHQPVEVAQTAVVVSEAEVAASALTLAHAANVMVHPYQPA